MSQCTGVTDSYLTLDDATPCLAHYVTDLPGLLPAAKRKLQ